MKPVFVSARSPAACPRASPGEAISHARGDRGGSAADAHAAGAAIVHIRARAVDGQAERRPGAVPRGAGRPRRALRRDRAMADRRRRRHDRRARPRGDRVPAGDGDLQLRLVQLRDLQGAPPAGVAPWEVEYLEGTRDHVFRNTFGDMEHRSCSARRARSRSTRSTTSGTSTASPTWPTLSWSSFPVHVQFVLGVLGANAATRSAARAHAPDRDVAVRRPFTWCTAGVGHPAEFHLAAAARRGRPRARRAGGQPACRERPPGGLERRAGGEGAGVGAAARQSPHRGRRGRELLGLH